MQIIVVGMHRSGTSAVTRLINMMGAYVGTEGSLIESRSTNLDNLWRVNQKGFWERDDVVSLNVKVLWALGLDWNRVAEFRVDRLMEDDLDFARKRIHPILCELEPHRPWVIKDPRLSLLLPLWREQLEVPVAVHVWRDPSAVAASLRTRNEFPMSYGLALWEHYNVHALRNTADIPRVIVRYEDLMQSPVEVTARVHDQLAKVGVRNLDLPPQNEIEAFIDPSLYREKPSDDMELSALSQQLIDYFENGDHATTPVLEFPENALADLRGYEFQAHKRTELQKAERRAARKADDPAEDEREREIDALHLRIRSEAERNARLQQEIEELRNRD